MNRNENEQPALDQIDNADLDTGEVVDDGMNLMFDFDEDEEDDSE